MGVSQWNQTSSTGSCEIIVDLAQPLVSVKQKCLLRQPLSQDSLSHLGKPFQERETAERNVGYGGSNLLTPTPLIAHLQRVAVSSFSRQIPQFAEGERLPLMCVLINTVPSVEIRLWPLCFASLSAASET